MSESPFFFGNEIQPRTGDLCVTIPLHISSKEVLFEALGGQLKLPEYFGENWDAFEECIRDLSWLPVSRVILEHADIPLIRDVANARVYLAILNDAVRAMSKSGNRELVVVFPEATRQQIEWLLQPRRVP
jgi:RNAse (barnase) inhibitor barstar